MEANDDAHSETASDDGHQTEELTNGSNWKHGRQLLRQYLQEIGYTETIINVRSSRVRSLLGLPNDEPTNENNQNVNNTDSINKVPAVTSEGQTSLSNQVTGISAVTTSKQGILQQMNKQNRKLNDKNNPNNAMMSDVDATALRTYDFLNKKLTEFGGGNRIDEEDDVDVVINGEGEGKCQLLELF